MKIQKKNKKWGGGGRVGGVGLGGMEKELKFLGKFTKKNGGFWGGRGEGSGWRGGGQGGSE